MAPARESVGRFRELIYVFLKLGALSYGGPAIMGIMQAELQEKRQWLSKEKFLEGLGLVNMLPGPAATQLGIYIGYDRAGWRGGVLAGLCFMLPAFLILMTLTAVYSAFGSVQLAQDAFYGIGPVVLGIFVVAVWRLGRAGLKTKTQVLVAVASAVAVAVAPLGIASVLLLAGCTGVALYHSRRGGIVAGAFLTALLIAVHYISASLPSSIAATPYAPGLADLALFFAIFLPAFILMLSILPMLARFKRVLWLAAALKGITGAVVGVLAVSLVRLVPHAAPDATTVAILVGTVAVLLLWRIAPLTLIAGGAILGIVIRLKPLQRLRELA